MKHINMNVLLAQSANLLVCKARTNFPTINLLKCRVKPASSSSQFDFFKNFNSEMAKPISSKISQNIYIYIYNTSLGSNSFIQICPLVFFKMDTSNGHVCARCLQSVFLSQISCYTDTLFQCPICPIFPSI